MNTRAEFYSDKFPGCEKEEEEINPGRHGKRLAEFIAAGLKDRGVDVDNLIMEDWGVMVPIKNAPFPLWIGCGNCDDQPDKYLCFIEPHRIHIRRWFRKIDTRQQVARLHAALNDILSSEPSIRGLKWTAWGSGD